ncbi:MAG: carboxypeptidase-like regulatory domain-containing protein [Ignavibacteriales bacterium]|nr:carboxypeptidase-like regulatory domain-containing protein [Ignavibacteriales bacterium]
MNIKSVLLILFFIVSSIAAQNNLLTGRVTDSKNGNVVQGAVVYISNNYKAYTNNDGYYTIKDMLGGNYNLVRLIKLL